MLSAVEWRGRPCPGVLGVVGSRRHALRSKAMWPPSSRLPLRRRGASAPHAAPTLPTTTVQGGGAVRFRSIGVARLSMQRRKRTRGLVGSSTTPCLQSSPPPTPLPRPLRFSRLQPHADRKRKRSLRPSTTLGSSTSSATSAGSSGRKVRTTGTASEHAPVSLAAALREYDQYSDLTVREIERTKHGRSFNRYLRTGVKADLFWVQGV